MGGAAGAGAAQEKRGAEGWGWSVSNLQLFVLEIGRKLKVRDTDTVYLKIHSFVYEGKKEGKKKEGKNKLFLQVSIMTGLGPPEARSQGCFCVFRVGARTQVLGQCSAAFPRHTNRELDLRWSSRNLNLWDAGIAGHSFYLLCHISSPWRCDLKLCSSLWKSDCEALTQAQEAKQQFELHCAGGDKGLSQSSGDGHSSRDRGKPKLWL